MKTLCLITALFMTSLFFAQEKGVTITVVFENLTSNEGSVGATLYDETTFMKAPPLKHASGSPQDKSLTLTLENVMPGEYGIITLHDLNDNGRIDFEASGMPSEPYGTSNNVMTMGPPSLDDAQFTVGDEDLTLNIRM